MDNNKNFIYEVTTVQPFPGLTRTDRKEIAYKVNKAFSPYIENEILSVDKVSFYGSPQKSNPLLINIILEQSEEINNLSGDFPYNREGMELALQDIGTKIAQSLNYSTKPHIQISRTHIFYPLVSRYIYFISILIQK